MNTISVLSSHIFCTKRWHLSYGGGNHPHWSPGKYTWQIFPRPQVAFNQTPSPRGRGREQKYRIFLLEKQIWNEHLRRQIMNKYVSSITMGCKWPWFFYIEKYHQKQPFWRSKHFLDNSTMLPLNCKPYPKIYKGLGRGIQDIRNHHLPLKREGYVKRQTI